MADSDKTLELLIQFKAELSEAIKSREQLVEMKRQATAMGVSTAGLDEEIRKVDASISTLGKKTLPESNEEIKLFNTHGREMHRLMHEINKVSPVLGLALRSIFNPANIGMAATVLLVSQLVSWLEQSHRASEELKKSLEAMPELSGLLGQTAGLREAMEDAHLNTEKFFDGLQRAHDNAVTVNTVLEQTNTLLKAQATAEDEIAKKAKERELARLEFLHNSGQLNDAQYVGAKAATEQDFSKSASQRKVQLDQNILNNTSMAFSQLDYDKILKSRQLSAAQESAANAELRVKHAEENLKTTRENFNKQKDFIAGTKDTPGLQDQANKIPITDADRDWIAANIGRFHGDEGGLDIKFLNAPITGGTKNAAEYVKVYKKLLEERSRANALAAAVEPAEAELFSAKKAALKPTADLEDLRKKITDLQTQSDQLKKQIEEKKAALDVDQTTAARTQPIEDQTTKFKAANDLSKTDSGKALLAGEAAARRLRAGIQTKDDADNLVGLASQMAGHAVDLQTAVSMMEAAAKNTSAFINLANRLAAAVEGLKPNDLAALEERVQQLEFQNQTRK